MKHKCLVTGGAGFLGSHVADELSVSGYDVTVLDVKESNYLKDNQKMLVADLLDYKNLEKIIKDYEYIFHFAGISDIDDCAKNPIEAVKNNVLATTYLLQACSANKIKRFIFASSAYVYSKSGLFYRSTKKACEDLIDDYYEVYNLPYTILRFGSLYGTRATEKNSIHRIIKQALFDKKIVYYGTGEEIREFIHVKDVAKICTQILSPEYENKHYMLTGNEKMKYKDLLQMVQEISPENIQLELKKTKSKIHYKATQYNFIPTLGEKIVANPHIDMGQGLLNCFSEIYEKYGNHHE